MAEKGVNTGKNESLKAIGMVLKPFLIYYIINFITAVILTFLVTTIIQETGGVWAGPFMEQEATVNAVIGGLAMMSGILPLFSAFRKELHENNRRNNNNNNRWNDNNDSRWNNNPENNNRKNSNEQKNITCNPDDPQLKRDGSAAILKKVFITIALAFTSSIAVNILFIILHLTENSEAYGQVAERQYGVIFPIGLFLYGIVSPLAEEVVFRGIIYNRLKKFFTEYSYGKPSYGKSSYGESSYGKPAYGKSSYGKPSFGEDFFQAAAPIVLSALLFGMYHGNIVQMLYGFLMGILIAYTYEKCGRFLYAFLFHAVANAAVYVITGSPVLYERFITPCNGIILAAISGVLLLFLKGGCTFRRSEKFKH